MFGNYLESTMTETCQANFLWEKPDVCVWNFCRVAEALVVVNDLEYRLVGLITDNFRTGKL